jgi:hypothetical protein
MDNPAEAERTARYLPAAIVRRSCLSTASLSAGMRAVQITRFGGPEVLELVDVPEPVPSEGQTLYDVSTAGVNYADTHH